jgi:hypothetical protein
MILDETIPAGFAITPGRLLSLYSYMGYFDYNDTVLRVKPAQWTTSDLCVIIMPMILVLRVISQICQCFEDKEQNQKKA